MDFNIITKECNKNTILNHFEKFLENCRKYREMDTRCCIDHKS